MNAEDPVEVVLSFVERINGHNVEELVALMSEDHRFVDALGRMAQSREEMRKAWTGYFRLFPDYRIACEEVMQKGNVVGLFGTARGTYAAGARMSAENSWEIPAAWRAVVRDGRVAEWRVYADNEPVRRIMATDPGLGR